MYSDALLCMDPACRHWHRLEAGGDRPSPRGWLAATASSAGLVVHGGNSLTNERLVGGAKGRDRSVAGVAPDLLHLSQRGTHVTTTPTN